MISPERSHPPKKRVLNPLAATVMSAVMSMSPLNHNFQTSSECLITAVPNGPVTTVMKPSPEYECEPLVRAEGQLFGGFGYGHQLNKIMDKGDIAAGFLPVNGVEYGEEDVKLIYKQLEKWKYANLDFVIFSWHSKDDGTGRDFRDKFIHFFIFDVMKRPDNPHPNLMASLIIEIDSNKQGLSDEETDAIYIYLAPIFQDDGFLKDEEGNAEVWIYGEENEALSGNPFGMKRWHDRGKPFKVKPYVESYVGDFIFDLFDEVAKFNYQSNIWDIFPSGIDVTNDVFRITNAYWKEEDVKRIRRSPERVRKAIIEAIRSKRKRVVFVSLGERFEHSEARATEFEVMHDAIPPLPPQNTTTASGDQYLEMVQRRAERLRIIDAPELPVGSTKENVIFFGMVNDRPRRRRAA